MHRTRLTPAPAPWLPGVAFGLCLTLAATALADVIVLKNRVEYRGAIVSEDVNEITILSDGMEWTFSRDKVASVTRDKKGAAAEITKNRRRLDQARAARAREDEQRARAEAGKALAARQQAHATRHAAIAQAIQPASAQVVVYGTSWCGYCRRARAFFSRRQVPFLDKDIERDPEANLEMQRKCAEAGVRPGGVPVIDVFGTMVLGFDQNEIESLLSQHGY